ncbi:MAG: prepilin-type N-terminal cleavage/methylation domain-containing protein [Planctomycetota bacterium]
MRRAERHKGFTLIEITVVLGLILVLATLAIPAVNALRGTRSAEAGANVAAAMLSRARAEAVDRAAPVGVLFYVDPETRISTMALVGTPAASLADTDPFDQYMGWRPSVTGAPDVEYITQDTSVDPVVTADTVIILQRDNTTGRPIVRKFICRESHTSTLATAPPSPGDADPDQNQWWGLIDTIPSGELDLIFDEDNGNATGNITLGTEVLPNGVGLQVIIEPATDTTGQPTSDRYARTGVILFDADGKLLSTTVDLQAGNSLGALLGLDNGTPTNISDDAPLVAFSTGFGIIAYNEADFSADEGRTDADWLDALRETTNPDEGGYVQASAIPNVDDGFFDPAPLTGYRDGGDGPELAEEQWLDVNATPLMINRFSGLPFNTDGGGSVN